jgi:hypothetical protein
MAVYRGSLPQDRFTSIANDWVRDKRMKLKARGLLVYIASHKEGYRLTVAQMIAECADGRDAVYAAIKELKNLGDLRAVQGRGQGGLLTEVDYELCDPAESTESADPEPEPVGESTASGFSVSGESVSGESVSGSSVSGEPATKKNTSSKKNNAKKTTSSSAELALVPEAGGDVVDRPETAQSLLGWFIDGLQQHNMGPVAGRVKGQLAKEIKALLDDGFTPDRIQHGLVAWYRRQLHPSALASVVQHAAPDGASTGGSRTEQAAQTALDLSQRMRARSVAGQ